MKNPVTAALLAALLLSGTARAAAAAEGTSPPPERYALGLIWKGSAWSPERSAHGDSVQAEHLRNNQRMFEAGRLLAAGPCSGNPDLRGIWVWRVDSLAEIPALLAGDPAVQERRLRCDVYRWFADPGIGDEYRTARAREPGRPDSMVSFSLVLLRRGPAYTSNWTPKVKKVLGAHARNTAKLRREGALVLAGSIAGLGDARGLLVFATDSSRTAKLLAADPAVKAGRFVPEIWKWWTALGIVPGH
ncbi:MAG: hypothetical protein IT347_13320 [Candidatus Eisenbacteria bacterium]|nr:hypothetical protein [Candidatus Eisenbacteria bacterium]